MREKKRVGALLLALVLVFAQFCLPWANNLVSADATAVEGKQEETLQSQEVTKEDEEAEEDEAETEKKTVKTSSEIKKEKNNAPEDLALSQSPVIVAEPVDEGTEISSADSGADTGEVSDSHSGSKAGDTARSESVTGSETATGSGAEGGSETGTGSGTESGNETGTGSGTEGGSETGTVSGTESEGETETGSGTEGEGETETGSGTEGEGETETGSGTEGGSTSDPEAGNENEGGSENDSEMSEEPYHVTLQVLDENEQIISNAAITMLQSNDGVDFETKNAESDGSYSLYAKQEDDFFTYKFRITAVGFLDYEGVSFCFDENCESENPYFDVSQVEQSFVITVHMAVDPNMYRVQIKAVDEDGNDIEDAIVEMKWAVDIYKTYPQEEVSPGFYSLKEKRENGDWLYYTFRIMKTGYTPYDSTKFCFRTDWWNPYFDVKAQNHFLTITVQMISLETTLNNAKRKVIQELKNYKKLEDYRQAEQEKIAALIEKWTDMIQRAETEYFANWCLKTAKEELDLLKTNIEYEDEEYRTRIYFQTNDGQKTYVDKYGIVTITNIDSGNFYITHPDGSLYANNEWDAKWRCVYEYEDQDHPGNIAFQVIVGTYGQYAGKFVGEYDAAVTLSDLGRAIHFTVRIVDGRIDQLRAKVDGRDMSGKTLNVMGSEKKKAVIEGRMKGTNRWVSVPAHALKYTAGGSTSVMPATEEFRTWGTSGSITYTLDADRSVSVTVNIQATIVKPTGVKVICPSKATVGDWNGAFNQYVGIMEGQDGYRVEVTPSNASNPGVTWEDLTPDVATFQTLHALGIVPKKAGTAKFRVTCVADPKISTTVTILFQYEKPLKTAEAENDVYYAKTSDKTISLNIITNGQKDSAKGASEQRFYWSYSTSGVAKVTDTVHYDKTSVTIPNWFSHSISILGDGIVYVTGTPYDTTENCKPVTFKVVVSDNEDLDKAEAERVEKLILAIGKVTLEKKGQIQNARSEFKALTSMQKDLVDDDIYAILVKAELELRRLERSEAEENNGDGDKENGNGSTPEQGESGNHPQKGENTDTSGSNGQDKPGATEGTQTGEAETGEAETVGAETVGAETGEAETGEAETGETGTIGDATATEEIIDPTENTAETSTEKEVTQKTVTVADADEQQVDATPPEQSGKKSSGKKFFEVDIHGIQEEIKEIMNEISPAAKATTAAGAVGAFVFGFLWRRRQYLRDKKKK